MIFELPNFITDDELKFINNSIENFIVKNSGEVKENSYRDGKTISVSHTDDLKNLDTFLFEKIFGTQKLLGFLKRRYFNYFESADTGYEFHRYEPGEICHIHADGEVTIRGDGNEGMLRFASIVLHLNTPSSGGELVFPSLNRTVKTEAKKLVIFPPYGFAKHYTTSSESNRDIIVTWFVYKDLLVRYR